MYTDACFFPNIHELDFAQEGIRIELDEAGKPQYHGIVFNEMKGAMSGEIDQLYYALTHHLFPTYSHRHYPALSKIVAQVAREQGLSYRELNYSQLMASQQKFLKSMGRRPTA